MPLPLIFTSFNQSVLYSFEKQNKYKAIYKWWRCGASKPCGQCTEGKPLTQNLEDHYYVVQTTTSIFTIPIDPPEIRYVYLKQTKLAQCKYVYKFLEFVCQHTYAAV